MSTPMFSDRSGREVSADAILSILSDSQYLHPHKSLGQVLREAVDTGGICPDAIARSMQRLQMDASRSIGRLRRSELVQLARGIYRSWKQAAAEGEPVPSTWQSHAFFSDFSGRGTEYA